MGKLDDLIARVEAASDRDRSIDADIARMEGWTFTKMKGDRQEYWRKPGSTEYWDRRLDGPPAYTASIDVALALIERLLPGWDYGLDRDEGQYFATIAPVGPTTAKGVQAEAKSQPLAIMLAALRALASQGGKS